MYVLDTIFNDMRTMMKTIIIKYTEEANNAETVESKRESDRYMSAIQSLDSFNTYQTFESQAFINADIKDPDLIVQYQRDKHSIPVESRERLVIEQRKILTTNYVEKNDYYRMLIGLPNLYDFDFIYVDSDTAARLSINVNVPVHELSRDDIIKLEKDGFLDKARTTQPTKKYLKFLGNNAVNLVQARSAKNFSILRLDRNVSENFYNEINDIYEQCREYYMTVIYNKTYGKQYDYYDNFIAMMIMVMTIQRLISNAFKYGIEYDLYDLGSIKLIFDAYNVPFMEKLPIDYQRILVRNLNNLLRYKSTDKVLYDICSLMGYDRIQIYKYFLIKEHILDINDKPVFIYKDITNPDGTTTTVEDYDKMYNLYFQSIELKERNVALSLANSTSNLDYNQVVSEDPYWWDDDEELKNGLYQGDYNFVETKYLSMNIMYKLTEMLFEISYVFRMIIDKKAELGTITITLPKMFDFNRNIDLFKVTALLCALISKKNGMAGNIIYTSSKALSVLGFNFKADFEMIKNDIRNNPSIYDQKLLQYFQNIQIFSASDVNNLYKNIRELNDFLIDKIAQAKDMKHYRAYKKLFETLMITEHMSTLFEKSDGTVANTFLEYLHDADEVIALFVENAPVDNIGDYIDHIIYRLGMVVTEAKYLNILNDSNSAVLNAVITLIKFFKSYTTDMTSFNILYLMENRFYNMLKFINHIADSDVVIHPNDLSFSLNYKEKFEYTSEIPGRDKLLPKDDIRLIWD